MQEPLSVRGAEYGSVVGAAAVRRKGGTVIIRPGGVPMSFAFLHEKAAMHD